MDSRKATGGGSGTCAPRGGTKRKSGAPSEGSASVRARNPLGPLHLNLNTASAWSTPMKKPRENRATGATRVSRALLTPAPNTLGQHIDAAFEVHASSSTPAGATAPISEELVYDCASNPYAPLAGAPEVIACTATGTGASERVFATPQRGKLLGLQDLSATVADDAAEPVAAEPVAAEPSRAEPSRRGRKPNAVDCAGASRVIDGSELTNHYVHIKDIEHVGVRTAYEEFTQHNWERLRELLPELPYSAVQVNLYFARHCRGIYLLHYPPASECGPHTNLALDVHKKETANDPQRRVIYKLKSSCILLHSYAVAHNLLDDKEKYGVKEVNIVDATDHSDTVVVNNRSAVALDFDHVELFPTFDDNKLDIRQKLELKHGKERATEYMLKAAGLYANLALARQRQVYEETGVTPPIFLWNAGKTAEDKPYGGALIDVSNALQSEREAGRLFSSHHPAFLMKCTAMAKLGSRCADDAAKGFAMCVAPTAIYPVAPFGSPAPVEASATAGIASDSDVAAATPPTPSTAIVPWKAGFWGRFTGMTTSAEHEQAHQDMLEHCDDMREKMADMRAAVALVEGLQREGLEPDTEQQAAATKALPSVQRERDGAAHGREKTAAKRAAAGGGRRCGYPDCDKAAAPGGVEERCSAHGGGPRCGYPDCDKAAVPGGVEERCSAHGGGRRCGYPDCDKAARPGGVEERCGAHGGGPRCGIPGCEKGARHHGLCTWHASQEFRDRGTRDYVTPADGTNCPVTRVFWPHIRAFTTQTEKGCTAECCTMVRGGDGGSHMCGHLFKGLRKTLKKHLESHHPEVFAAHFAPT